MYEIYERLRNAKGVTDYQVSKETGIPKAFFSEWKSKRYKNSPKFDRIAKIAEYFGVSVEEFTKG